MANDNLSLGENAAFRKMLTKHGNNFPNPEKVLYSDIVIKINKREKEQNRVLVVTDKAVYNVAPNDYGKCKRRIAIETIMRVTLSTLSDEFVLHVPDEYDYRYSSAKKKIIAETIAEAFSIQAEANKSDITKLRIKSVDQPDLKDVTVTKDDSRLMDRTQRFMRRKQMAEDHHDSDDEEAAEAAEGKDKMTDMLEGQKNSARLEDFELLKVIGRGSFGKVMLVRKKDNQIVYAMKILRKKAIIARNQVEHTRAERQILQQLQHPFLMTLRYAFQSKEKLYFVLDYYRGGELFFHLKNQRRFSEEVARIYVAEIALALGHLHSMGVVYRDLKPENILLDDVGHVCLTDFGLSKDIDPDDKAHTFCGTPEYLAPEIVSGSGHDKNVDWWSLGILLYELTVGIPPFYSQNVNEMYNKIQHGVLRFPPFLSDPCKNLIVNLLHRDPTKRLGSANDIDDIKTHDFFKPLDLEKLMKKEVDVPYKPKVKGNSDTSNFDDTFTSEPVVDTHVADSELSKTMANNADAFSGFTFQEQGALNDK